MLKNPSFEDSFIVVSENFDDWAINFNTIRTKVTDATNQIYALKLQTNRTGSNGFFAELSAATPSNDLNFEEGKTYTISFDYKVETGTITELRATLQRDNFYLEDEEIITNQTPNGWQTFTYDFTAVFTAAHNFDVNLIGATANAEILIDNTSITEKIANSDRDALIALYNATDGANWTETWDLNSEIGTWPGITVNAEGRVIFIQMDSRNIVGQIPDEIGNLSELQILDLGSNKLTGEIPATIGNLSKLERLTLRDNELTGNIPAELGNLSNLEVLLLSTNRLQGTLPIELGNLSSIEQLILAANQLSGLIPTFLGNLSSLTHLSLFDNQFTGGIPPEFGSLGNLESLILGNNNLTGTIPSELYNLSLLRQLNLFSTGITGEISSQIGNLAQLESLRLGDTQMTGSIPAEIGNLTQLQDLGLFRSNFSGPLPQEIGNLTNLTSLRISSNNFNGTIPSSIGNLTQLKVLNMGGNNFSGSLPSEIGNLILLEDFYLQDNTMTGNLPPSLGNLSSLKSLWLSINNFSGAVPPEIGNLTELETLVLNTNEFTGIIPTEIGNMLNLELVDFSFNNFTGSIPVEIENLPELTSFACSSCGLSSTIPIFNASAPIGIGLQDNNLVFNDLENSVLNSTNTTLFVNPQNEVDNEIILELELGDETNLTISGLSSANNEFQWRKDGINLVGETNPSLLLTSVSQTSIGVYDCVITNPNVPSLTLFRNPITITINGLDGESDDDNDGVKLSNDDCPNTPPGASVDLNGCAQSQLDDDMDGVNNSLDICPNTGLNETVNALGCSINQLLNNDDDNDGVPNEVDNCQNTPAGAIVDNGGCSYLDVLVPKPDDFTAKVTSTTCPDTSNGKIEVSFKVQQTHYIMVLGPNGFSENYTKERGSTLNIPNLPPGEYKLIVNSEIGTFLGAPDTEFSLNIETPEDFTAGKVVVDNTKGKLVVSGSSTYDLLINEKKLTYTFGDTGNQELVFDLEQGANNILIKTDKDCQGQFKETIMVNSVRLFPNPTSEIVQILGLKNEENVTVNILNTSGVLVKRENKNITDTSLKLNLVALPKGLYLVQIKSNEQDVNAKIIKK